MPTLKVFRQAAKPPNIMPMMLIKTTARHPW